MSMRDSIYALLLAWFLLIVIAALDYALGINIRGFMTGVAMYFLALYIVEHWA